MLSGASGLGFYLANLVVKDSALSEPNDATLLGLAQNHLLASAETKRQYAESSAGDLVKVGRLIAESQAPVDTTLKLSDGTTRTLRIPSAPESLSIGGSWNTSSTDPQGFSVLHETTFDLPAGFATDRRVTLDLGDVAVMAKVAINDTPHDTLWRKPYQFITSDLKPGTNRIRVLVTSTSESKPSLGPATLRAFHRVIVE